MPAEQVLFYGDTFKVVKINTQYVLRYSEDKEFFIGPWVDPLQMARLKEIEFFGGEDIGKYHQISNCLQNTKAKYLAFIVFEGYNTFYFFRLSNGNYGIVLTDAQGRPLVHFETSRIRLGSSQ